MYNTEEKHVCKDKTTYIQLNPQVHFSKKICSGTR